MVVAVLLCSRFLCSKYIHVLFNKIPLYVKKNRSYSRYHDNFKSKDHLHKCHLEINPSALKEYPYMDQSSEFDHFIKRLGISHPIEDEICYFSNRSGIVYASLTVLIIPFLVNTLIRGI